MISAVVGWGTNLVAVKMMFQPVDFVGIKPWFGWQGIIPANATTLAARSTEVITTKLIKLKELFDGFDSASFADGNLDKALDELTDQVIAETASKYAGDMWAGLDENVQKQIRSLIRAEIEQVSVKILDDLSEQIEEILDLKGIVVDAAHRDRKLIGEMFQRVGSEEFKFIKISGLYFGFAFGIVQLLAWAAYPAYWVLPLFGFFVGYATNWVALKLIFAPRDPKKFLFWTIHGLFHKRQKIVAKEFSTMVSSDIINPDNMVAKMIEGERGEKLFAIVEKHIGVMLDKYKSHPMFSTMIPADEWDNIRSEVGDRVREELPKPGGFLHTFTSKAVNVYGELHDRMTVLDSKSFEGILRPPFQKDEWKLIVAGAVLGLAAGVAQVLLLFRDQI